MKVTWKKAVFVSLAVILIALLVTALLVLQKPEVRFMLAMTDILKPSGVSTHEISLDINGVPTPMMEFRKDGAPPGRYYFFLHGVTPQTYRHPTMMKLGPAIAGATGRTVLAPRIQGSETSRTIEAVAHDIANIYTELRKRYPGSFHAFAACISGTILLASLNHVPLEIYPEKIFLYGPFLDGKMLANFYNTSGMEIDYIVRMTNAMRHPVITGPEKDLISRAILATKPGLTDREEMKRILGAELYRKVDKLKIDNPGFLNINELTLFPAGKPLPKCRFYTLHSRSDQIIPFTMGLGLHRYLSSRGLPSRFVATGAFQHSGPDSASETAWKDLFELADFLRDLFK